MVASQFQKEDQTLPPKYIQESTTGLIGNDPAVTLIGAHGRVTKILKGQRQIAAESRRVDDLGMEFQEKMRPQLQRYIYPRVDVHG